MAIPCYGYVAVNVSLPTAMSRCGKISEQLSLPEANPLHTETLFGEAYLLRIAELHLFGAIIYGVREGKQNGEWVVTWRDGG